jgi:hypothetical protein
MKDAGYMKTIGFILNIACLSFLIVLLVNEGVPSTLLESVVLIIFLISFLVNVFICIKPKPSKLAIAVLV